MYPFKGHIVLFFLSFLIFISCEEKNTTFVIDGKIPKTEAEIFYAIYPTLAGEMRMDTIHVKDKGNFIYTGKVDSLSVIILGKSRNNWIPVFVEPNAHIHINANNFCMSLSDVKGGGKLNEELNRFRKEIGSILQEKCKIEEAIREVFKEENEDKNLILMEQLHPKLANLNHALGIHVEKYVEKNPEKYTSVALLLEFFCKDNNMLNLEKNLSLLEESAREFSLTQDLMQLVAYLQEVTIGSKAPDFTLKNTEKEEVSLSDFYGQYVMLYFWATDEPFSRMGNRYFLREIYEKYRVEAGAPFSIIGISLDNKEEKWKHTIASDSMKWINLSDLKGINSRMMYLYGLYNGPKSFLIDPEGIIIGDDIRTYPLDSLFSK